MWLEGLVLKTNPWSVIAIIKSGTEPLKQKFMKLSVTSNHNTACVNKSASLKEHFFLGKLYVSFEKVYNNMIGNIISFYRIFVLCNLDVWFRNYGKSCEVPPNLVGLIH